MWKTYVDQEDMLVFDFHQCFVVALVDNLPRVPLQLERLHVCCGLRQPDTTLLLLLGQVSQALELASATTCESSRDLLHEAVKGNAIQGIEMPGVCWFSAEESKVDNDVHTKAVSRREQSCDGAGFVGGVGRDGDENTDKVVDASLVDDGWYVVAGGIDDAVVGSDDHLLDLPFR